MKILIIRPFPDKLNLKSYNVQEVGLAKALVMKGHICDIVLYHGKEKDKEEEYSFSVGSLRYSFKIYWLQGYSFCKNGFMPSVKKLIPKYEVIQVHEYDQLLSWKLYTRQPKPVIIYHGPYYGRFAKGYNLKCRVFDLLFLSRIRSRISSVSAVAKSALAADFLREKGFQKVITAGVGIDLDNFGRNKDGPIDPAGGMTEGNLLYVGKIEERRNLYFLAEVFRKLREKKKGLRLIIIGNGEKEYKEKFLVSIQKELEEGSILYREVVAQEELAEYYRQATFFLLASRYEIFGMVLLEAMYFGVPVISSVNGGSCTLIEDGRNGLVMERFDADAWAERIQEAMEEEGRLEELRRKARETIEKKFTWNALADTFLAVYRQTIDEHKGNGNE